MKVSYRQSGGFAGIVKECEMETGEMDPAAQEAVQTIIHQVGAEGVKTALSEQARDAFVHDIRVEQEGKTHQLIVDDVTAPATVRPLIAFLKKRAKQSPRG